MLAALLSGRFGATLHALHIDEDGEGAGSGAPLENYLDDRFREALYRSRAEGEVLTDAPAAPVVCREIKREAVGETIVQYAVENRIELIVMGMHGRRGVRDLLMGSTADEVVRTAPCPVLVVPEGNEVPVPLSIDRILMPIDFSAFTSLSMEYGGMMATRFASHIDVFHVIHEVVMPTVFATEGIVRNLPGLERKSEERMKQLAAKHLHAGQSVAFYVEHGYPQHAITGFAERSGADLIVIATHGLTGVKRFLLGSVTEKVIRSTPCPVFVVKDVDRRKSNTAVAHEAHVA
jgi:nucleotide-binding universal stress UspA family protein